MKKTTILILFIIFSSFILPLLASARMQFIPHIDVSEEYNDNIYLDRRDKEDDWITTIEPGLSFLMQTNNLDVDLDYSWNLQYYKDNSDENQTDFRDIQRARGLATLFPGDPFTIVANANVNTVIVDERERTSDENSFVNRALMYDLSINPNYNWRISPTLYAVLGYTYHYVTYQELGTWEYDDNNAPNDWQEHVVNFDLVKQFSARTSCGIGYVFTDHRYDNNDEDEDFKRHDVFATLEQKIGSRLSFNLKGGRSFFDFDESGRSDGNLWGVGVDYKVSNRTNLGFTYERDYNVSVNRGISKSDIGRLILSYHDRINANLEGFATKSKYSEDYEFEDDMDFRQGNSEDKSIGSRLYISYPLGKRFTINFDADYAYWKFKPNNEKIDRYGFGGSVDYNFIRNFDISLSYEYRINDSDMDENDYRNNIAILSIGWRLDR